jgi:hypothetical protein
MFGPGKDFLVRNPLAPEALMVSKRYRHRYRSHRRYCHCPRYRRLRYCHLAHIDGTSHFACYTCSLQRSMSVHYDFFRRIAHKQKRNLS